ncbi:MAG TPA: hypothetical protein VHM01_04700 [Alphaproteobacteria bacterium]|nr:hypothetical protein [Alphaproteobacteria bacterium]
MRKADPKDARLSEQPQHAVHPAVDAKTARLRMLRLAKEAAERTAAEACPDKRRTVRPRRAKSAPA